MFLTHAHIHTQSSISFSFIVFNKVILNEFFHDALFTNGLYATLNLRLHDRRDCILLTTISPSLARCPSHSQHSIDTCCVKEQLRKERKKEGRKRMKKGREKELSQSSCSYSESSHKDVCSTMVAMNIYSCH